MEKMENRSKPFLLIAAGLLIFAACFEVYRSWVLGLAWPQYTHQASWVDLLLVPIWLSGAITPFFNRNLAYFLSPLAVFLAIGHGFLIASALTPLAAVFIVCGLGAGYCFWKSRRHLGVRRLEDGGVTKEERRIDRAA